MDQSARVRLSWNLLRYSYGVVILLVGLDKIFGMNLIVQWSTYISPFALAVIPVSLPIFFVVIGIVEVIVAVMMLMKWTRLAGQISILWLVLIAANLLMAGYIDIAVRDILLAVGAFVLAELTIVVQGQKNA